MRKFMITAAAALALAAPTAALAGDFTGVSTNGTTNDAIGFCVQNGTPSSIQGYDDWSRSQQPCRPARRQRSCDPGQPR